MNTNHAQFPPFKSDLIKHFGYLSFHLNLINTDLIGIRLVASGEIIVITYRANRKTGFIYEGEKLNSQQVFHVYCDVPDTFNELEIYENQCNQEKQRIEVLAPPRDQYVFINETEIRKTKIKRLASTIINQK
ncbi:hypothetical protein AB670_02538 [Chryseobacterium sp. MOF25P]|uniref:hypothetical protein n=1 Tax=unclassified Chryseobacterium TaxID=2593645 RepID=UPI0008056FAA|nr:MULTISPECIES: hypothetical protein [unclassified Chryseobacterium]MBO6183080.1 hypothetical protein [Chryseobacterium sp.]OBW41087.1 hypothetical protein AB670_02538 [Chryseobacterium sp. MOF25P]OBW45783.1 hypothetical protein AB671_02191 [Chryseobacterium sp. BGARF1]